MYQTPRSIERFWSKVATGTGCWEWQGYRSRKGYGKLWWGDGKRLAHRISWGLHNGPIPDDMWVLHHCDNPPCVRPSHLFLGTPLDNMRDMIRKGRARHPVRYGLRTWSKLTEDDVRAIRAAYAAGGITQQALADQYGVSRRLVGGILQGRRWASTL